MSATDALLGVLAVMAFLAFAVLFIVAAFGPIFSICASVDEERSWWITVAWLIAWPFTLAALVWGFVNGAYWIEAVR